MSKNLFILSLFFSLTVLCQTKEEAFRDANITTKATLQSDIKTVLQHTYPPVLEMMGGREKALTFITKTMEDMTEKGFKFENATVISVSKIVKEQNQNRCFVKNNYTMTFNGYRIKSEAYLLGIYNDDDKFWYFIEAKQLSNPAIETVLPNFKTALIIPEGKSSSEKI